MGQADMNRPNEHLAVTIDETLRLLPDIGRNQAAQSLRLAGVPFAVICRVLSEPTRTRRQP